MMIFFSTPRKMSFVAIVAIFCIASLVLPAFADDDGDSGSKKKQLLIESVFLDSEDLIITIKGRNFVKKKKTTVVYLSDGEEGRNELEINEDTLTATTIEASLPASYFDNPGDYLLTITRGNGQKDSDSYGLTIGAVGPQGPAGMHGLNCWDLNGNGECDSYEDKNGDSVCDTNDLVPLELLERMAYFEARLSNSDFDGDNVTQSAGDCDDSNSNVSPFKAEIPDDGIDNNCDGEIDEYVQPPLGTEENPGLNCQYILTEGASIGDGVYWIDPDGDAGNAPFQVFCDMTTDGGGWTFFAHQDPNGVPGRLFDTDIGTYRPDRADTNLVYSIAGSLNNEITHIEMMVTLDQPDPQTAAEANKIVFFRYQADHAGFSTGPIPCSGLTDIYPYRVSLSGPYTSGGTSNACDSERWFARTAGNQAYLTAFYNLSGNGSYWGIGMGGDNSWFHDSYWYVR